MLSFTVRDEPTTVSKGPSGESPARISAVNPGVSVVTAICDSSRAAPASSTRPTPGFENESYRSVVQ